MPIVIIQIRMLYAIYISLKWDVHFASFTVVMTKKIFLVRSCTDNSCGKDLTCLKGKRSPANSVGLILPYGLNTQFLKLHFLHKASFRNIFLSLLVNNAFCELDISSLQQAFELTNDATLDFSATRVHKVNYITILH